MFPKVPILVLQIPSAASWPPVSSVRLIFDVVQFEDLLNLRGSSLYVVPSKSAVGIEDEGRCIFGNGG